MITIEANILEQGDVQQAVILLRTEVLNATVGEMAEKLDISPASYKNYEAKNRVISIAALQKLCNAYDLECKLVITVKE